MNIYYFPINSSSLAHYFAGACIKPARYFDNKPQDIQDRYREFLLLSNKKGIKGTDCCLELVLTDDEIEDLIDAKNGWYLLDTRPLPITRIKKIYFANKEQMDNTITNISMSTAFVPNVLLDVCTFNVSSIEAEMPVDCNGIDQTNKIIQYDRFLGALAMMRLAHEPYMNYSPNYFATLSFFNSIIEKQTMGNKDLSLKKSYQGIFNASLGFEKVLPYLEQKIGEDALNKIASEHNEEVKKDKITRTIDVESITNTWPYTIAILNAYGVGEESRRYRIDELILSSFQTLREGKQEGVALCYGYNRGYSAFTKNYGAVNFKYKLESKLDYYTIESVYQYVFNGKVSSEFAYLDTWCPNLSNKYPKHRNEYMILDEVIIGKKKAKTFSQEWWNGFFQNNEKTYGILFKSIFEVLKPIIEDEVYNDIKDELQELYQVEIDKKECMLNEANEELDRTRKELEEIKRRNIQLIEELKGLTLDKVSRRYSGESENIYVVAESHSEYNTLNKKDETLKERVVLCRDLTIKELKKKTKSTDEIKLGELLLTLKESSKELDFPK